jgi:hypothetical protein
MAKFILNWAFVNPDRGSSVVELWATIRIRQSALVDLLILEDDWGAEQLNAEQRRDLAVPRHSDFDSSSTVPILN